jgi:hypothetical protein
LSAGHQTASLKPGRRLIPQRFAAGFIVPIKATPSIGKIQQESETASQPWRWLKR